MSYLVFRWQKIHHGMPSSLSLTRRPYPYIPSSRFEKFFQNRAGSGSGWMHTVWMALGKSSSSMVPAPRGCSLS
jgi:hypothetical protein